MFSRFFRRLIPAPAAETRLRDVLFRVDGEIRRQTHTGGVLGVLDASKHEVFRCFREHFDSPAPAKALTLKVQNLCLAKYHFLSRSTMVLSRPFGLVVDPCNACGLACPGCVHSARVEKLNLFQWDNNMLSGERAESLLSLYGPYAVQAVFCNYGEPLLNPETPRFIRRAKSYLLGTMISTSLSLPRFDADAYVESGLDYMVVSIDGVTQPVYERFRKRGNLDRVFGNLKKLVQARRRLGKRTPVISWHFLAFQHNLCEIAAAAGMARDLGVNRFVIAPPFNVAWDDPGIRPAIRRQITLEFDSGSEQSIAANWNPFSDPAAAAEIDRAFEERWSRGFAHGWRSEKRPAAASEHTCRWLYKNIVMDAGGRVFPCCGAPRPDVALTFARFDGGAGGDPFNAGDYRLARSFFANPGAYWSGSLSGNRGADPHCVKCEWSQTRANVDSAEVEQYLKAAGNGLFDRDSARMLTEW